MKTKAAKLEMTHLALATACTIYKKFFVNCPDTSLDKYVSPVFDTSMAYLNQNSNFRNIINVLACGHFLSLPGDQSRRAGHDQTTRYPECLLPNAPPRQTASGPQRQILVTTQQCHPDRASHSACTRLQARL